MQPRDVSRFDEVRIAINVLDPLRLLFIVEIVGGCKGNSFQPVSEETLFFNCFRIGPLSPIFVRFFFFIGEKLEAICKLKSCFVVIQSFKWRVI